MASSAVVTVSVRASDGRRPIVGPGAAEAAPGRSGRGTGRRGRPTSCGWLLEGILDVRLAEGEADLAQVLAVRPHQRRLADVEAGQQDQAVVPVALDRALEQLGERLLEGASPVVVQGHVGADADPDVVDEDPVGVETEGVRALVEGLQPEVVEQREQLGQRRRGAAPVDAEAPLARRRVDVATERGRQVVAGRQQVGDAPDVADGPIRGSPPRRRRPARASRPCRTACGPAPHRPGPPTRPAGRRPTTSTARRSCARGRRGRRTRPWSPRRTLTAMRASELARTSVSNVRASAS